MMIQDLWSYTKVFIDEVKWNVDGSQGKSVIILADQPLFEDSMHGSTPPGWHDERI